MTELDPEDYHPATGDTTWMSRGACRNHSRDMWFPGPMHPTAVADTKAKAKAICDTCTVSNECLEYALRNRITYGMWGGTEPKTRRKMLASRSNTRWGSGGANHDPSTAGAAQETGIEECG